MKTKIKMTNGDVFIVDMYYTDFVNSTKNSMGILISGLQEIIPGTFINYSNICSVEKSE